MSQRRYGPTRGPGVAIVEKDAEKTITPSALGVTVHSGVYERGMPFMLNYCPGKRSFMKKMGGRLENGYLAPDAAMDFFDLGEGAGELWCVRVTDGSEVKAEVMAYSRRLPRVAVAKFRAKNGGRWGGKRSFFVGKWTLAGDLTETTLTTGKTMLPNFWVGGTLKLAGVPTKSYTIVSNDAAGVVTVISDAKMKTDYGSATSKEYTLELDNAGKQLAVMFKDGTDAPTEEWHIEAYVDGVLAFDKDNLSSNPISPHYYVSAINDDTGNDEVEAVDLWTGGYAADIRPANHYEQVTAVSATALSVEIMQVTVNSATGGNATIGGFSYGQLLKQQKITLTFTSATAYDAVSDKFGALGTGALGAEFVPGSGTAWGESYIPKFTGLAGTTAMVAGDTIVIECNPLVPDELIGSYVYPDKVNYRREFFQITDNTVDTVTVRASDDMSIHCAAGTKATLTGTATGPFTCAGETFKFFLNGGVEKTATLPTGSTPATTVAGLINTAAGVTIATVDGTGHIVLTSNIGGRNSLLKISNGTGNTLLGFTTSATSAGAVGDQAMLMWPQQMSGGYDGLGALADDDFERAYDTANSCINQLYGKNKALAKLGTPGVTSTSVQKKGAAYAQARNYQYRYECPANIVTETAADEYLNDTLGRNDFAVMAFPSFGYMANPAPDGQGLKLISLTGAIHGREAQMAYSYGGYHKAAAGVDVTLPHILKLPTGDKVLDEEYLNPLGIQVIKFKDGNCIVWGDRSCSIDPAWKWKHQREQMSYYEGVLRENFDWVIFSINDARSWGLVNVALYDFFAREWSKRALRGNSPEEAFSIKIDSEINTAASMAAGDMNAEIRLRLADTVERFIITMSKLGIFEDIGT